MGGLDYPFKLSEKSLRIEKEVVDEDDLPLSLTEFTTEVFEKLGRPGVTLHPRALMRAVVGNTRGTLCPQSWPTPTWAVSVIEQITFDISGMQPRLLYNDKPWLEQPAIYTDCYAVVARAKRVADEWIKSKRDRKEKTDPVGKEVGGKWR